MTQVSNLTKDIDSIYHHQCCPGYHTLAYEDFVGLIGLLKKAAKRFFQRGAAPEDLNQDIVHKEYDKLFETITDHAHEKGIDLTNYVDPKADTLQRLRTNLLTFVAFKNYKQQSDMIKLLVDEHGKIRSYNKYGAEVIALGQKYNRNFLKAEYNTAIAAAQTATQWTDFQRQKDLFPYLVYKSQDDAKVREAHKLLHNVAKHIDDPFWNENYPPNGWNCRCYILQSTDDVGYNTDPDLLPSEDQQPTVFRHNPGKSYKIWSKDHPYFQDIPDHVINKIYRVRDELIKDAKFFDRIDGIDVHYTNYLNDNFPDEFEMATKLNALGNKVKILQDIVPHGYTAPDYLINDYVVEYKKFNTESLRSIEQSLRKKGSGIDQLMNSAFSDLPNKAILIEVKNSLNRERLANKILQSERMKYIELWIYQNGTIYKYKK